MEHFDPPTGHLGGGHLGGDTQNGRNPFDHRTLKKIPSGLPPDRGLASTCQRLVSSFFVTFPTQKHTQTSLILGIKCLYIQILPTSNLLCSSTLIRSILIKNDPGKRRIYSIYLCPHLFQGGLPKNFIARTLVRPLVRVFQH